MARLEGVSAGAVGGGLLDVIERGVEFCDAEDWGRYRFRLVEVG